MSNSWFWDSSKPKDDSNLAYGDNGSLPKNNVPPKGKFSKFQHTPPKDHGNVKEDTTNWKKKYELLKTSFDIHVEQWKKETELHEVLKSHHNAELADIQRNVFKNLPESNSRKTDDDLQREIMGLRNGITLWAKKWARSSLVDLVAEDLELFRDHLTQTVLLDPDGAVLQRFLTQKKFLWLLLGSLLSYSVHCNIIQNPFFFVRRHDKTRADNIGDSREFCDLGYMEMCAHMTSVDEVEAHLWRSERVRAFQKEELKKRHQSPNVIETKPDPGQHKQSMDHSVSWTPISLEEADGPMTTLSSADHTKLLEGQEDSQCTEARQRFLSGFAGKLIEGTSAELQSQLDRIFARGKSICLDIWTRRSNLACSFAQDLKDEVYVEFSEKLVPHMFLRPNDCSMLRDKHFSILVHPLMEVFGNEEGQKYSTGRVLIPAIAWFLPE